MMVMGMPHQVIDTGTDDRPTKTCVRCGRVADRIPGVVTNVSGYGGPYANECCPIFGGSMYTGKLADPFSDPAWVEVHDAQLRDHRAKRAAQYAAQAQERRFRRRAATVVAGLGLILGTWALT